MTTPVVIVAVALGAVTVGFALGFALQHRRSVLALGSVLVRHRLAVPATLAGQLALLDRVAGEADDREVAAVTTEKRLRGVLEGYPAAVVLFDRRGQVREANEQGLRLVSGRHGDALVMVGVRELLTTVDASGVETVSRVVELAGPPRRTSSVVVRRLPDDDRLAIIEDITERRRLEDVRRDFVANISHELKTPIGALALLAETMSAEDDPELLARLSQRMHREALRVGSTIDDLLMLSRIEATDDPVRDPLELDGLITEAVERILPAAEARGIEIRCDRRAPGAVLPGDRRQLVSALYNLLENAVKYSDDDSVIVVGTSAEDATVSIDISDRGMGIPAKDLERIFERFYRVDRARSRLTGGTGLGLAIVRHVAQNHGGSVRVSSQEGEGSTFTLTLPTLGSPTPTPETPIPPGRDAPAVHAPAPVTGASPEGMSER